MLFLGWSALAHAATGTPSTVVSPLAYDARTLAMGGAGVALTEGGAAAVHNPAAVALTQQTSATGTFSPYMLRLKAPFTYANQQREEVQSGPLFGPFSQLGLNVRVNQRVVMGMVAFVNAAAGGVFDGVPLASLDATAPRGINGNARVAQVAGELRVPVAVQINRRLFLGAAYRITLGYALASISSMRGKPISQASIHGTNVRGFALGAMLQPHPRLRLGLSYRSQVSVDLSGTLKLYVGQQTTVQALSRPKAINTPHEVKLGGTWRPPAADALLLAGEVRLAGYHWLNRQERHTVGGSLGAEYGLRSWLSLRLGYSVSTQPTRPNYAQAFAAPPGLGHGALLGTGVRLGDWCLDAAIGYLRSGAYVPAGPSAGHYRVRGLVASASASYAI